MQFIEKEIQVANKQEKMLTFTHNASQNSNKKPFFFFFFAYQTGKILKFDDTQCWQEWGN